MTDESVKAYADLTWKCSEIRALISRIREEEKKCDRQVQDIIESILKEYEACLDKIDCNLFKYFNNKEKANLEYISLTISQGNLILIHHDLKMGYYNKVKKYKDMGLSLNNRAK